MPEPTIVTCSGSCTVTHVVSVPVLDLDTEQGGEIAAAVLLVWAVAFGFRALIRTLDVDSGKAATRDDD